MITIELKKVLSMAIFFMATMGAMAQTINTQASMVTFEVSNMKWRSVEGKFSGMKGDISFDANNVKQAKFDVCIDASTVNTANKKRDDHLKNEDFFEVEKYPEICFTSSTVKMTKDGFVATGELTMHGVTKTVDLPFTYQNNRFEGKLMVNRTDFNVGSSGSFMVGHEVALHIICVVE